MDLPPFVRNAIVRLDVLIAEADGLQWHTDSFVSGQRLEYSRSGLPEMVPIIQHSSWREESPELIVRFKQAITDIAPGTRYEAAAASKSSLTQDLRQIASALRKDMEAGFYRGMHDLAHAEVFGDLIDEAEYQLAKGYVVAAAVIAGAAAESHLRRLLVKKTGSDAVNGKPLMGEGLNVALVKENVYGATEAKLIRAWQSIRNEAAHEAKADTAQVRLMLDGLKQFMANHPA